MSVFSEDYTFTSPNGHNYIINVCQPVMSETWAVKVDKPENIGGFTRREHGDFALG
jgi:cation-dependent mannose-6-phosphate receptor